MFDQNLRIAKEHQASLRKQADQPRTERTPLSARLASIVRLVLPGLDVTSGTIIPATH
jgi:hypothetical protein